MLRSYSDFTEEYTNALFLLPNGKYGNANEAGNYLIGFAVGYSGSTTDIASWVQVWTRVGQLRNDEPHEQALLKSGQAAGTANYKIGWWNKYQTWHMDTGSYNSLKSQYQFLMQKYKGSPLIKQ